MRHGDSGAEIAELAADKLPVPYVDVDDAELLQSDNIFEYPTCTPRLQILLGGTELLDDAPDGRGPVDAFAHKTGAQILISAVLDVAVEIDLEVAELIHHDTFVFFVEEHVAVAPNGQLFIAVFLKATKSTAFAAKRLRILVYGAHSLEIVRVDVRSGTQPVFVVAESELETDFNLVALACSCVGVGDIGLRVSRRRFALGF